MNHLLLLPSPLPLPLLLHRPSKPLLLRVPNRRFYAPKSSPDDSSGDTTTAASEPSTGTQQSPPSAAPPSGSTSNDTSVKNRLRSRNQARRVQDVQQVYLPPVEVRYMKGKVKASAAAAAARKEKPKRRKEWGEMSLAEKAMELYVGEKGALFWLNKFAYASIFIMAGAWILFRFVGPLTGLYQLDAPPLAPADVLRGS